ncbi:MAG: Ig-like domain-containing protein [Pseudomonadota bacterium]
MQSFLIYDRFLAGGSDMQLAQGNAAPIAVSDTLDVVRTDGPVSISVLANDVDPEGQPLTLVSAFAALGSAVAEADNTVTYTPPAGAPPGVIEFDTVVYEIADVEDARSAGQVDITLTDPDVSVVTLANNTLQVSGGDGPIDIAISAPAAFAGTYTVDLQDLGAGPVNLVPPTVSGSPDLGATLTATDGLWIYDEAAGTPVHGLQWQRSGVDISGATAANYTLQATDVGVPLNVVETLTDANGSRSATSETLGSFSPSADTALVNWWDASDAATIVQTGGALSAWADKAGGANLVQNAGARQPTTGVRTFNGLNVVDFDGGDYLDQSITLPASGDVAFHMVLAIDSTVNAFEAVMAVDATNDFQVDAANATQFDGRVTAAGIGPGMTLSGGPFAGTMILSVICDFTGSGQLEVFINNVSRGTMTYSTPLDAAVSFHLMTNRAQNASVNGAVAEIAVTGDTGTRAQYHSYLAEKWGIA